jgi:hypothetical protein
MEIWIRWTLIIIAIFIFLILLIKFITYKMNNGDSLDSRISGVRSGWDNVCKKIGRVFGC